jgi:hypothetical protein
MSKEKSATLITLVRSADKTRVADERRRQDGKTGVMVELDTRVVIGTFLREV